MLSITTSFSRKDTLKCLDKLPRLSPMKMKLLGTLARPQCGMDEVKGLIEKDPLLSGQLLKMANSAAFARSSAVSTIKHALTMLGTGNIRKLALTASVANLFSGMKMAPSFSMARFNLHSVATGTLSELLAGELPVEHGDAAFIAGMLHDVGKILLAVSMPEEYEHVLTVARTKFDDALTCEHDVLGVDHAELSEMALARWELDRPVRLAARYHHTPDEGDLEQPPAKNHVSLATVVNRANGFVNYLGISALPSHLPKQEAPSLQVSGQTFSETKVMDEFEARWKAMGDLFR
jgi:HD-like signal output (HDOD) protein